MDNLSNLKRRLNYLGGNAEGRLIKEKLNTFKRALGNSYQSANVKIGDKELKVLINPDKLKQDYDDKIVSALFDSSLKIGDVLHWVDTDTHWIIYLQQLTERAYFRAPIRQCDYQIHWVDELGISKSIWAAIRGPVETKIVSDTKSDLIFDSPNETLNVLIPNNEDTSRIFKRYYKILIAGKSWEVQSTDSMSVPGIIEMTLKESYKTSETAGGVATKNHHVTSSLDVVNEISIEQPFNLTTRILFGTNPVELPYEYKISRGNGKIVNNALTLYDTNPVEIQLLIQDINFQKMFTVTGVEDQQDLVSFNIEGPLLVKPYGETVYTVKKYVNGVEVEPNGSWDLISNGYCEISSQTEKSLKLKWLITKSGKISIVYGESDNITKRDIIVDSLF